MGCACLKVITMAGSPARPRIGPIPNGCSPTSRRGRAPAIRSAASSPTLSPAVRYWNWAGQRYNRLSARYSRARVSLPTQAARPGPDNRGKPRLLDLERRIPARDRFAPDSPLEGDGFELVVPRHESRGFWSIPGIVGAFGNGAMQRSGPAAPHVSGRVRSEPAVLIRNRPCVGPPEGDRHRPGRTNSAEAPWRKLPGSRPSA